MTVRIGELARRTGVSPSAIRNWEKQGVIPEAPRSRTGYRVYREADIPKIKRAVQERLGHGR
jgi:MerR family transcriptional regulator, copper efflux regulator